MDLWGRFLSWWFRKEFDNSYIYEHEEVPTPEVIVKRVKRLFKLHGVEESEIPEVYPEITLYDLQSDANLLQKLTPDFLRKLSEFFQIRIEWLRSGEPHLYDTRHWYKDQTLNFFEDLKVANFDVDYDPFEIITTIKKFDINAPEHQPFILVIKVPVANIDDRVIHRYLLESEWDWHHVPCRMGAKAIATKYYELTKCMIPIYTVDKDDFKHLSAKLVTPHLSKRRNNQVSFEEYGALQLPHMKPYEHQEYEFVVNEIKDRGLDQYTYDYISQKIDANTQADESTDQQLKFENHFKKAAYASHEDTYQLKRDCIIFWMKLSKPISNKESARRFIKSVSQEKIKKHSPTNLEDLLSKAISEYRNKEKILAEKKNLPNWLNGFNPS